MKMRILRQKIGNTVTYYAQRRVCGFWCTAREHKLVSWRQDIELGPMAVWGNLDIEFTSEDEARRFIQDNWCPQPKPEPLPVERTYILVECPEQATR